MTDPNVAPDNVGDGIQVGDPRPAVHTDLSGSAGLVDHAPAAGVDSTTEKLSQTANVTIRPRRIAMYAIISATVIMTTMVVVGILLRNTDLGVAFQWTDQLALIGLGALFAAGVLMMARPRLRADATGIWVRNIVGERFFEWPLVLRVAFPTGANWAQLVLPDDETHPVMAIQSLDRQRAVEALKAVRALHTRHAPPPPEPPPDWDARLLAQELDRPLGRLERIDREMAGVRPKPKRRR